MFGPKNRCDFVCKLQEIVVVVVAVVVAAVVVVGVVVEIVIVVAVVVVVVVAVGIAVLLVSSSSRQCYGLNKQEIRQHRIGLQERSVPKHSLDTGFHALEPLDMSSDRGSQFTSSLWNEITHQLGIKLHRTTAYHPQSNSLVEHFHRTLKAALKARLQGPNWVNKLPWVLLGLRTVPKEDLGTSAAELVFGEPLTVPEEFIDPTIKPLPTHDPFHLLVKKLSPIPTSKHGQSPSMVSRSLQDAQFVFIRQDGHRGPLQQPYDGPFRVLSPGDKTFLVRVGDREERISTDHLQMAHMDLTKPVSVAQPPRRGRLPLQITDSTDQAPALEPHASSLLWFQSARSGRAIRPPRRFQ
ncbi:Pol polyprotein [Elysia marginata]|uniref:Pol polyprotein n=1 Tax=Elysia marginata TaxID=1093978 RepID=A0AAV4JCC9_9GAST|nr:Pol polyprotein [Elysia marginata]